MKQVTILQINGNAENAHYKMFSSMRMLQSMGLQFNPNDYKVVFSGEMDVETAEDVYSVCNIGRKPNGYNGHSLSVSDIVAMDGKVFFCDSYGFKDVTDMWTNR